MNRCIVVLAGLALAAALPATARSSPTPPPPTLPSNAGTDRIQKLIEGAKKEGELSLYTSHRPTTSEPSPPPTGKSTASR